MTANSSIIPRITIRLLTFVECHSNIDKRNQLIFLKAIKLKLEISINPEAATNTKSKFILYEDNKESLWIIPDIDVQTSDNGVNA